MVKIIRLVSGEEICCVLPKEQLKEKSNMLRLSEPMLIKYVPQITEMGISDYIALVKWVGFTDDKIITIPKDKILTIANATKPFTRRYHMLVDSMNKAPQKLPAFVERDLNNEDYNELDKRDNLENLKKFLDMPSKKIH
tara:strand:+ start:12 stop:428 length:417 start_codon:yes stop_codon:yes gene_type:complete